MQVPERRRRSRERYCDKVHVLAPKEAVVTGIDLNEQGLGFLTEESIPPGTPVTVVMFDRSIAMEAICRYQLAHSMGMLITGVEFLQLQPELVDVVLRRLQRERNG